ncbi:MAG: septum formation protein Maf [Flavobacteriales bacterium]|jgi:septum formation protein|nr:septum formation protein Maf [Flavobacteriales bacterium]MBT4881397.1 septum formation protein Maf [Flavobacteriales bacterium]|tara:strand:+ start:1622 stop:2206 length:585 start_codon:yes stop_codon:yes gene_type:complete
MLNNLSKKYNIILGSASPRRKELLTDIGLEFNIQTTDKEEDYPLKLKEQEIAEFLAKQKSEFLSENLLDTDLLITADTIVSFKNKLLNKPKDKAEAFSTLSKLSENTHKVITGVCIKTLQKDVVFSTTTMVTFRKLEEKEINHYINNHNPYDKAGAYGIQDWIGKIGIGNIEGSYSNVVGLPTSELYEQLKSFV